MKLEVNTPSEFLGTVIGDLSSRRGQVTGTSEAFGFTTINAFIPLEGIRGYATVIRSLTQGRGNFYPEPSHYDPVPRDVQESLTIKKTA
jgi:elongation factor G